MPLSYSIKTCVIVGLNDGPTTTKRRCRCLSMPPRCVSCLIATYSRFNVIINCSHYIASLYLVASNGLTVDFQITVVCFGDYALYQQMLCCTKYAFSYHFEFILRISQ